MSLEISEAPYAFKGIFGGKKPEARVEEALDPRELDLMLNVILEEARLQAQKAGLQPKKDSDS